MQSWRKYLCLTMSRRGLGLRVEIVDMLYVVALSEIWSLPPTGECASVVQIPFDAHNSRKGLKYTGLTVYIIILIWTGCLAQQKLNNQSLQHFDVTTSYSNFFAPLFTCFEQQLVHVNNNILMQPSLFVLVILWSHFNGTFFDYTMYMYKHLLDQSMTLVINTSWLSSDIHNTQQLGYPDWSKRPSHGQF